jgi:hypothetical protein
MFGIALLRIFDSQTRLEAVRNKCNNRLTCIDLVLVLS